MHCRPLSCPSQHLLEHWTLSVGHLFDVPSQSLCSIAYCLGAFIGTLFGSPSPQATDMTRMALGKSMRMTGLRTSTVAPIVVVVIVVDDGGARRNIIVIIVVVVIVCKVHTSSAGKIILHA